MIHQPLLIAGRELGPDQPCLIIAEAGVNHNGDPSLALRLVDAAADAQADAVKFQTFVPERIAAPDAPLAAYQQRAVSTSDGQRAMLRDLVLPLDAMPAIITRCRERGLMFLSTPFDETSADRLYQWGAPAYKTSSGDLTHTPFLAYLARKGLPMLISTGMAYLAEVDEAIRAVRGAGCSRFALMHCTTQYPADPASINLRAIYTLQRAFCVPVGYSDHTIGIEAAIAAVAMGACIIEKHLTLDHDLPGPDHRASMLPAPFAELVRSIRLAEKAQGSGLKEPISAEEELRVTARRSLYAIEDIPAGEQLGLGRVGALRPAHGIPPAEYARVSMMHARRFIAAGELLHWRDLE